MKILLFKSHRFEVHIVSATPQPDLRPSRSKIDPSEERKTTC